MIGGVSAQSRDFGPEMTSFGGNLAPGLSGKQAEISRYFLYILQASRSSLTVPTVAVRLML